MRLGDGSNKIPSPYDHVKTNQKMFDVPIKSYIYSTKSEKSVVVVANNRFSYEENAIFTCSHGQTFSIEHVQQIIGVTRGRALATRINVFSFLKKKFVL